MKTRLSFLIIALLVINTLTAQIKIGDNPQNIHPASVLELESPSRVLVITRVTSAQMNTITPLRGALVYNTDEDCVHYYDGSEWINICEAFDNSFTVSTNAVFNAFSRDSTVVVTQTDTNYNFEVNQITGDNIVDTSINGANEIQQGSITGLQISNATITFNKLADGGNTGDLLRWNGAQWVLENEGVINITEKDSVIGNEVLDARPGGALERFGMGVEGNPFTLDVRVGGIENNDLAADAVTTDKIFNGTIINEDIADNAITSEKILDGEVDTQDIADQAITIIKMGVGSVGTNQIVDDAVTRIKLENGVNVGDLMRWDGTNWVLVNETALNITENDGDPNNEIQNLNIGPGGTANQSVEVAISGGTSALVDIRDEDSDPANENQTVSAGTGINVAQTGQDFQVTNAAPDQIVTLADGGGGNVTVGGTYPNFTIDIPNNTDSQNLSIGPGGTANQSVEVAISGGTSALVDIRDEDSDPANENQTVSAGTGINVAQTGQDFTVAVTNPVIAMGRVIGGIGSSVGSNVVDNTGGSYTVNITTVPAPTNYVVQLTINSAAGNVRTIQVTSQLASSFDIQIYDGTGATADSDWYYTVISF
ncbi:hypothetical protein [Flagellimonas meishanensis]|uniref:hypothetical protein n=1 Tax=Flagellimonas meishanensis TaxID=2873264 RepID=UPI001CA70F2E|nr:hypothetical protein [[Muricauda] meishanensis]